MSSNRIYVLIAAVGLALVVTLALPFALDQAKGTEDKADTATIVDMSLPKSHTGVSGPIEQGDAGFAKFFDQPLPTSRTGVSGPIEQGDAGFQ